MSEQTQENKSLFNMVVAVVLTVLLVGVMVVPIINTATQTTTTTSIDNEGAGWLKLGYNVGADYSFNVGYETITVDDEETEIFKVGEQIGDYENMICYADPQRTLFISGDSWYLLTAGNTPSVHKFTDTASVSNTSGTLTINDGSTAVYSGISPTWAYVPDTNGVYGFFTEGRLNLKDEIPKVAVGSYAGVFTYNQYVTPYLGVDLGLAMVGDYSTGEVVWEKSDIEPTSTESSPSPMIMAVPTPTYSEGDWGFDIVNGNEAKIVSYSGTGGNIVVPSSVSNNGNTYTVTQFGKGGSQNMVFDNTTLSANSTITLPDTLVQINDFAFCNAMNLTGTIIVPDSVTTVKRSFTQSGFSEIVLPNGITSIGDYTFLDCTNLVKCDIPDGVTSIGEGAFTNTRLENIVIPEGVTSIGSSAFTFGIYEHLILPMSLVSLNGVTFSSSNIKDFVIQGNPTITGNVFVFSRTTLNPVINCLNLSDVELTATSYGLNISEVRSDVPALGYVAPVSIHDTITETDGSLSSTLMQFLPVILVLALIVLVGTAIMIPKAGLGRYMDR